MCIFLVSGHESYQHTHTHKKEERQAEDILCSAIARVVRVNRDAYVATRLAVLPLSARDAGGSHQLSRANPLRASCI